MNKLARLGAYNGAKNFTNMAGAIQPNSANQRPVQTPKGRGRQPKNDPPPYYRNRNPSSRTPSQNYGGVGNNPNIRGGRGNFRGNQRDAKAHHQREQECYSQYNSPSQYTDYPAPHNTQMRLYNHPYITTHNRFAPLQDTYNDDYHHYMGG